SCGMYAWNVAAGLSFVVVPASGFTTKFAAVSTMFEKKAHAESVPYDMRTVRFAVHFVFPGARPPGLQYVSTSTFSDCAVTAICEKWQSTSVELIWMYGVLYRKGAGTAMLFVLLGLGFGYLALGGSGG